MPQSNSQDLSEADVRSRLASYSSEAVTDQLYDFGRMLLQDAVDRISKMDSKAAAVAAYSGAVITVLISTEGIWIKRFDRLAVVLLLLAGIAAALAGAAAVHSIALQRTEWFTANEWMNKDCLGDADRLKRYHLLTMWTVILSHQQRYRTKVVRFRRAQFAIVAAGFLVACALFEVAARSAPF